MKKSNGYTNIYHTHRTMHSTRNIQNAKGTEEEEQRSLHEDVTVNLVVQREVRNPCRTERGENSWDRGSTSSH